MILRNRVLWSDNGTLKDISEEMNNHVSGTKVIPFVSAEDYIYLGSDAPFNHRWIEIESANALAANFTVDIWDGANWIPVAEIIDQTNDIATGTKALTQSGRLAWVPDKQETSWSRDDTYDHSGSTITGLGTVKIYDLFWARIGLDSDITATTELSFVGYKFANDEDLYSLYPEFETTEAKERFKTGLTTWDQIHFEAAKEIIRDLKAEQVINTENQIIEWDVFRLPAIHKAANLVYSGYGSDWKDEQETSSNRYKKALKMDLFNVDLDASGSLTPKEARFRAGRLYR